MVSLVSRRRRTIASLALLATLVVAAQASATDATPAASASQASLYGVRIELPGRVPVVAGAHAGSSTIKSWDGAFGYPEDGSIVNVGTLTGSASSGAGGTAVSAGSDVAALSLFNGEITADAVTARVASTITRASGSA